MRDAELVRKKVVAIWLKNYIEPGEVTSLIHCFHVEKGLENILMAYNCTVSGFNEAEWVPHFGLHYVTHTACSLIPGYCRSVRS